MTNLIPKTTSILEGLATKSSLVYKTISLYYRKLVKDEIDLAKIKSSDKVLCIGGGQCPFSGILLHEYTGADITIVDCDDRCVQVSRELIQSLGYERHINILHMDGTDALLEDYDVVHTAVQVCPIDQVFSHLKKRCNFGAKILVRLPKKSLKNFYSVKSTTIFKNYCGKIVHSWRNIGSTMLFVKAKEEYEA